MIILGLGSNLGDRADHLRKAIRMLSSGYAPVLNGVKVSPIYESRALFPAGAPASWNKDFLNCAIAGTTTLDVLTLFHKIKSIEKSLGRIESDRWSPRAIDIDILTFNDDVITNETLTVPHRHLHERPFALYPLLDLAPHWVHPVLKRAAKLLTASWAGDAPLGTQRSTQVSTKIVGIINTTPDSFSDGSVLNEPVSIAARVRKLITQGASVIDVGAESTRPGATLLTADDEWARVEPFLKLMQTENPELGKTVAWSIDTRHGLVAERAFRYGVNVVNDVSGLDEERLRDFVKEARCQVVVTHHLGIPPTADRHLSTAVDVTDQIIQWGLQKIEALSPIISPDHLILDPGIGFGKSAAQSFELIHNAGKLRQWPTPVYFGHSRKSFLPVGADRDDETAIITASLAESGVAFIRVHDVARNKKSLQQSAQTKGVFL